MTNISVRFSAKQDLAVRSLHLFAPVARWSGFDHAKTWCGILSEVCSEDGGRRVAVTAGQFCVFSFVVKEGRETPGAKDTTLSLQVFGDPRTRSLRALRVLLGSSQVKPLITQTPQVAGPSQDPRRVGFIISASPPG